MAVAEDLTPSGKREVFFELNGQLRTVLISDKEAAKVNNILPRRFKCYEIFKKKKKKKKRVPAFSQFFLSLLRPKKKMLSLPILISCGNMVKFH
jgi:hypothetical protein